MSDFFTPAIFPTEQETDLVRAFFGGGGQGFFVEVGANEPQRESQSWHLEQMGWIGILIEPQPSLAEKLRKLRKAKVFSVACSSPQQAGRTMTLHVAGPYSSFTQELMVTGVRAENAIEVPVQTLDSVLAEAKAPVPIDFLSIDVEGHEIEVLQGFDIARWRPRLILIEDHVSNLEKHRYLTLANYRLIRRTAYNGWYVPAETAPTLSIYGRWQLLRKYYLGLPVRYLRDAKRRLRDRIKTKLGIPLQSWRDVEEQKIGRNEP